MPVDNLEDRLREMNDAFAVAPVESPGENNIPDGEYQAVVRGFDTFEDRNHKHVFFKTELEVALDPSEGAIVTTVHCLTDPDRLGWLKKHLMVLGLPVEDPDFTLDQVRPGSAALEQALDVPVAISVKRTQRNGTTYTNVYVNERLGGPMVSDIPSDVPAAVAADPDPDDSIPF